MPDDSDATESSDESGFGSEDEILLFSEGVRFSDDGGSQTEFGVELKSGQRLGNYELLRRVGSGGQGDVWEAIEIDLRRRVAIKVLPMGHLANQSAVKRFKNEALAAAQLQHRSIVPVFHVGTEAGVHYYVMRYIEGGDLSRLYRTLKSAASGSKVPSSDSKAKATPNKTTDRRVSVPGTDVTIDAGSSEDSPGPGLETPSSGWSKGDSLASNRLIQLVAKSGSTSIPDYWTALVDMGIRVADALHHAHEMGIVHRDIKPSNLLLDTDGEVWVADFGLAKFRDNPDLTMTGAIVGTLRYLSPEQAMGRKRVGVDHRTDIYSFGVTLYELLTLQNAYQGVSREEILRQITFEDPTPPRRLDSRIPVELEIIVMKAMAKNPDDRYATAAELAEDLRLFRSDRPIKSRKPNLVQRGARWARRNQALVAFGAILTMVTMVAAVIIAFISWSYYSATSSALVTEQKQSAEIRRLLDRSEGMRLAAHSALELPSNPTRALLLANESARRYPGATANDALLKAMDQMRELHILTGHEHSVGTVDFSPVPDEPYIVSASDARVYPEGDPGMLWNASTGKLVGKFEHAFAITSAVFSPDGKKILTGSSPLREDSTDDLNGTVDSGTPVVWDRVTPSTHHEYKNAFLIRAEKSCFDSTGKRIVLPTLGNTATVFKSDAAEELYRLSGHQKRVVFAGFAPGDRHLVTVSDDNTLRIWDLQGNLIHTVDHWQARQPKAENCLIDSVRFRPDGRFAVTASLALGVNLVDLDSGKLVDLPFIPGGFASYSADGLSLVSFEKYSSDLQFLDALTGRPFLTATDGDSRVVRLALSSNGRWAATSGRRVAAHVPIWETRTGNVVATLTSHESDVTDLCFSCDSQLLATASSDETVRVWSVQSRGERETYPSWLMSRGAVMARSPESQQLVTFDRNHVNRTRVFSISAPEAETFLPCRLYPPAFSANRWIGSRDDILELRNIDDGSLIASIHNGGEKFNEAAISPRGDRVAAYGGGHAIRLWFPDQDRSLPLDVQDSVVYRVGFSPDGNRVVGLCSDGRARIWNSDDATLIASLNHDGQPIGCQFHPHRDEMAVVTSGDEIVIWNLQSQAVKKILSAPSIGFSSILYSHAGSHILSYHALESEAVQAWDVESGQIVASLAVTGKRTRVSVHPTKSLAVVASAKTGATVWDYLKGEKRELLSTGVGFATFDQSGDRVVVGTHVSEVRPRDPVPKKSSFFQSGEIQVWSLEDQGYQMVESKSVGSGSVISLYVGSDDRVLAGVNYRYGMTNYLVDSKVATSYPEGHLGPISGINFLDENRLVTSSWDGWVKIWEMPSGGLQRELGRHPAPVTCQFVESGKLLTADSDGNVVIWNTESSQQEASFSLSREAIARLELSKNGNEVFGLSKSGELVGYNVAEESLINLTVPVGEVADFRLSRRHMSLVLQMAGNGKANVFLLKYEGAAKPLDIKGNATSIALDAEGNYVYVASGNRIEEFDVFSGKLTRTFAGAGNSIANLHVDPLGEYVAAFRSGQFVLWKISDSTRWQTVTGIGGLMSKSFKPLSSDRRGQLVATDERMPRILPLDPRTLVETISPRDLTEEEKSTYLLEME